MVSIIPPAAALKSKEVKQVKEKRIKIRKKNEVEKGNIIISKKLAEEIGAKEEAEISVKGKRIRVKVIIQDAIPYLEVWANSSDLSVLGIEDNSTVTIRAIK